MPQSHEATGAFDDPIVRLALLAQEAQDGEHRRHADGSGPQPVAREPVIVEVGARRQLLGDGLVEAGHNDTSDSRVRHFLVTLAPERVRVPDETTHSRVAAILAGGQSRRLSGVDKSALAVGESRIIDRQLAVLRTVASEIVIVASDGGRFSEHGLPVLPDLHPGTGPLGAIHTALVSSSTPQTLIVACDLPFLDAAFLRHVIDLGRQFDAVVPRTASGYQPLCAVYARTCIAPIQRRLLAGHRKVTGFYEDVRVREVDHEELAAFDPHGMLFHNVNTPEDYVLAKQWLRHET